MERETSRAEEYRLLDALRQEDGALRLGPSRVVLMTGEAFTFLLRVIHEHAPHIVKYALYDMGYRAGEEVAGTLPERGRGQEGAFGYFVETYRQAGYGDLEVVSFDLEKPEALLRGTKLFESWLAREAGIYRSPRAVDHYSRGMLAGFMSTLLGREAIGEELACQYRGDPACEFVILPRGR